MRRLLFASVLAALGACAHGPPVGAAPPAAAQVLLEGRLPAAVERAELTVYGLQQADGLRPLAAAAVRSNHYRVAVRLGSVRGALLVRAAMATGEGAVLVVLPEGATAMTLTAHPIDAETTVEAYVYLAARAAGVWPQRLGPGRLTGTLGPTLARATLAQRSASAGVKVLARATAAATAAWDDALAASLGPTLAPRRAQIYAAEDAARAAYAGALDQAQGALEAEQVTADFAAGTPLILGLTGVPPQALGTAAQAYAESFEVYAATLTGSGRAEAWAGAERRRATYLTAMVDDALAASGAPLLAHAAALGEALRLRLAALRGDGPFVQRAGQHAWQDYVEALRGDLDAAAAGAPGWPRAAAEVTLAAAAARAALAGADATRPPAAVSLQVGEALGRLQAAASTAADAAAAPAAPPLGGLLWALACVQVAAR